MDTLALTGLVLLAVAVLLVRLHAFVALLLTSLLVALLGGIPPERVADVLCAKAWAARWATSPWRSVWVA